MYRTYVRNMSAIPAPTTPGHRARRSALEARLSQRTGCSARAQQRDLGVLARERGGSYAAETPPAVPGPADGTAPGPAATADPEATPAAAPDPAIGPGLRDAIIAARDAMERVRDLAARAEVGAGAVGGLLDLLQALDAGEAAAITLTARIQRHRLAPRATGLTLESFLAGHGPLPGRERRALLRTATTVEGLPQLAAAVAEGAIPAAALPSITAEARGLDAGAREELDGAFADRDRLGRLDPEDLVQAVRDAAARLAPAARDRDQLRPIEDRFLALQPRLDGSLTGYFELDAASGATLLEAIESAAPPPSAGPKDVTTHAHDDSPAPPAVPPSWQRRARGRQRADGLIRLAEDHLAGVTPGTREPADHDVGTAGDSSATPAGAAPDSGTSGRASCGCRARRARPRFLVLTDVATLTGHDELATASQLLWASVGQAPRLTPTMVRRLASDADLQLVLHDDGELLGITSPIETIPAPVRAAVLARDRGCRFPGCQAPPRYLDLHHVLPREKDGPTTCDNLVGLCRRHHTAVTQGRWSLKMTADGVVTVRRGRRIATSDPPHRRQLATRPDRRPATGQDPPAGAPSD